MTWKITSSRPKRVCNTCGSDKTYLERYKRKKDGKITFVEHWKKDNKGMCICDKCYSRYIKQPKWGPIIDPIRSPLRITFKDKRIRLKDTPRIGVCNFCRAVKDQINTQTGKLCKRTHIHHEQYHDDDL